MGAWGEGMQANDTALDYIGGYNNPKTLRELKQGKLSTKKMLNDVEKHSGGDSWAVLGVADWLLDHGYKVTTSKALLEGHLKIQRDVTSWRDGKARTAALERFRKRMNGGKISDDDVALDNLGLFDRIGLKLAGKSVEDIRTKMKKAKK